MSGDVFGNGMLLSKAIKLVAAFDHRHIFLDPDPDPAKSWEERKRLFDLPRSSWDDYDRKLISKGGGVFPRTPEVDPAERRSARRCSASRPRRSIPTALINAILKAPVDLLWFGGIGTYIKASTQSHAEVGDPANDALRVNADELRAKVDRRGRQPRHHPGRRGSSSREHGGRINTDFIDNSRRRRLLGQRGQHQDPAQPRDARGPAELEASATRCSPR